MKKAVMLSVFLLLSCLTALAAPDVTLRAVAVPSPQGGSTVSLTWTAPALNPPAGCVNVPTATPGGTGPVACPIISGYNVYRSGSASGPFTVIGPSVSGTTYVDSTVVSGQSYIYQVTALCATCNPMESGPSNQASASIPSTPPPTSSPGAPTSLSASVVPGTGVVLYWTVSPTPGIGYNISQGGSNIGAVPSIATTGMPALTTFTDTTETLTPGKSFSYSVSAYCPQVTPATCPSGVVGSSAGSNTLAVTVPSVAPPAIYSFTAVKNSSQTRATVTVSWTTPSSTATIASLFNQLTKWKTVWFAPGPGGTLTWSGASPQSPFIFQVCDQTPLCTSVPVQFTVTQNVNVRKAIKK